MEVTEEAEGSRLPYMVIINHMKRLKGSHLPGEHRVLEVLEVLEVSVLARVSPIPVHRAGSHRIRVGTARAERVGGYTEEFLQALTLTLAPACTEEVRRVYSLLNTAGLEVRGLDKRRTLPGVRCLGYMTRGSIRRLLQTPS